jgi:hypothetical protein
VEENGQLHALSAAKDIKLYTNIRFMNNRPTPWIRVLFEKLIVTQLVKKFSNFYGTQRSAAMFTRVHIQWCIQKFLDWLPGVRTANGTAFYHCIATL